MYQPFGYAPVAKTSIFSFLSKIKWSKLLSGTQKTINFVNQAIPLYYNIKPIYNNLKTVAKIGKNISNNNSNTNNYNNNKSMNKQKNNNNPTFFI